MVVGWLVGVLLKLVLNCISYVHKSQFLNSAVKLTDFLQRTINTEILQILQKCPERATEGISQVFCCNFCFQSCGELIRFY